MIKAVLTQKWSGQRWPGSRWHVFYRLKAALCILLNREPAKDVEVYEHVYVCWTDGGVSPGNPNHPTIYWSEAIVVGYGFWHNWWCTYYQDSSD